MPKVALIHGDGVGPEVMGEAAKLIDAINKALPLNIELVEFDLNADHFLQTGIALPEGVIDTVRDGVSGILMGPFGDPRVQDDKHSREILGGLIRELDLYVGLRRIRLLSAELCPLANKSEQDIDLTLIWEGKGGIYADVGGALETGTDQEIVVEQDVNTHRNIERVIRFAFEYAVENDRSSVTMVHKSRRYVYGHDLWVRTFLEVKEEFSKISGSHLRIETMMQQMVTRPEQFDLVVTNHLFGSILSGLGTALQGGQGLVASVNLHPHKIGLFRTLHPSSVKYTGKDYANPMAAIISVQHLMEFMDQPIVSQGIEKSLKKALATGWVTRDLGGSMGTREVGDYICSVFMDTVA